jgi:hypothetical protein
MLPRFHVSGILQTENGNFHLFLQTENGNGKLSFVCCKRKWKTDDCFPFSANDK